jgi:cellulose synthase/poly-beta-1,6-N-acetylglucosamine synthase-like glycosyltransferase/peptidoglycan/xylan/chitin deacetylase (PgdA/CDA1 family)
VRPAREPRAHWALLAAALLALGILLVIAGYTSHSGAERVQKHGAVTVASAAPRGGGPVLDATQPTRPGISLPARTIALTFDDGPSDWTPKILDVLERRHVPATFFVIGSNVTARPQAVRRAMRDGDEIGVHTFTHPDLADVPAWRERLELDATQQVLAAATGYTTDLMRPPYSSVPGALSAGELRAIGRAGKYRVVLTDLDTRDWARPGVDAILREATPRGSRGAVIMMHDGGGDRSQTVAALDRLIPALQARGYTFETVSQAAGVGRPWHSAGVGQRVRGSAVTSAVRAGRWLVGVLGVLFACVAALSVLRVGLLLLLARRHRRGAGGWEHLYAPLPPVTVVVPAFNEAAGIAATVRSLAASDYPILQIVVVDDGSTDATAEIVASLALPNVSLFRQPNAGKPAALNTGVAQARYGIVVLVDGDTVFERGTLQALVAPFADPQVGAVSGNTKVGNRRGIVGRWQHIEYVIGFNLDRRMFDVLQCMPTVPGAIGAFRRHVLAQVGGVSDDTLAEDTDLTMAICRSGWRVVYAPDARAWTEAPVTIGQLWRQRYRWCYGTMQAMWKHRHAVVQRGASGRLGRRGLPYLLLFQVLLPIIAPSVDIAALYGLIFLSPLRIGMLWLAFLGVQFVAARYAFSLDRESPRPLWTLPLQQVVYRQLMYLVVIQSAASALYGVRLRWQKSHRTGRMESAPVPADLG